MPEEKDIRIESVIPVDTEPSFKSSEQKSSFRHYRLKFSDEELQNTDEGKLAMSSLLGLNVLNQWTIFAKAPDYNSLQNPDILSKFIKETGKVYELYENIRTATSRKRSHSETNINLKSLEESIEGMRMLIREKQSHSSRIQSIDIPVYNSGHLVTKINEIGDIMHHLGNIITPISGYAQFLSRNFSEKKYQTSSPIINDAIQRANIVLYEELEKLAGEEKTEEFTPDKIIQAFWNFAVPVAKNPRATDPRIMELGKVDSFFPSISEKIAKDVKIKWSRGALIRLLDDIAQNTANAYTRRQLEGGKRAKSPKILIFNIELSEDGKCLCLIFRDNATGLPEDLIKKGFREAEENDRGYQANELIAKGEKPIESNGIGMKKNAEDLEDNFGGKVVLNNYEDTFVIGKNDNGQDIVVPVSGAEQIFMFPVIQN